MAEGSKIEWSSPPNFRTNADGWNGCSADKTATRIDPLLEELFKKLPPPDTTFTMKARLRWLKACAACFSLIFDQDEEKESIEISIAKERP
jgi:hypothetical protein